MVKILNGYNIGPSTLRRTKLKRYFDPKNSEDLTEYRHYIKKGVWRDSCPFELEWPYLSIPQMISDKIATYYVTKVAVARK